ISFLSFDPLAQEKTPLPHFTFSRVHGAGAHHLPPRRPLARSYLGLFDFRIASRPRVRIHQLFGSAPSAAVGTRPVVAGKLDGLSHGGRIQLWVRQRFPRLLRLRQRPPSGVVGTLTFLT